jgi:hypothetical protein
MIVYPYPLKQGKASGMSFACPVMLAAFAERIVSEEGRYLSYSYMGVINFLWRRTFS